MIVNFTKEKFENEKMDFLSEDLIVNKKNGFVILYNKKIKKHIRQTEEVYGYFEDAVQEGLKYKEFIDLFSDDDKKYIVCVIENMIKAGVLYESQYVNSVKNINLKTVHLSVTQKCNLKCTHCCTNSSFDLDHELKKEEIFSIVDFLKKLDIKELILTGGEPLVRSDFGEIVEYIKSRFNEIILVLSTNATLICEDNLDFIVNNFDRIEISIDGVDEDSCSKIRGKGVFSKVVYNINKLHDKNFSSIGLSMVFGQNNGHLKEMFKDLNSELKTEPVMRCFQPIGRGRENITKFSNEENILPMSVTKSYKDEAKYNKNIVSSSCDVYREKLYISHDGMIYPCLTLAKPIYSLGNIIEKQTQSNLISLYDDKLDVSNLAMHKNFEKILPFNYKMCKDCDVNIFCWTCPGFIDSIGDDEKSFSKWCADMKPELNRLIWNQRC